MGLPGRLMISVRRRITLAARLSMARGVNCVEYARSEMISPEGEHSVGSDGFMEFEADQEALERLVIDTFFKPME